MSKEEQIIKEYVEGKSISQLTKDYPNYSYRAIRKLLINNQIVIRGGRSKKILTPEQVNLIKPLYVNNTNTIKELANMVDLDRETLTNLINEFGWKRNNHNRVNKRIQSNYFSCIDTPEKAYWLGFLFTDGCVDHYRDLNRVRLQLQLTDKHILERFKENLCLDCKIIIDERPNSICCSVEFTDAQIVSDLEKYNIIPNKTYKINHIPYEFIPCEYLKDFARGLFDGDGNLYVNGNDVTFGFTSYCKECVEDFKTIINLIINNKTESTPFFTSAWHINWRGRQQVYQILTRLYENSTIHLNRKFQRYQQLANSLI